MSLEGGYDDANVFAKILRGDLPCHKVYEDDFALAFMDLFPQSPGHCLVVPKTPARNLFDIDEGELAVLITRVKKVASAVRKALAPEGVLIAQFNGVAAGQTVFHIHFHVIPRWAAAPIAGHGQAGRADDATLAEHAKAIASAMR